MDLKAGDVVKLKSGGPRMTVEGLGGEYGYGDEMAKCIWFEGTKKCESFFDLKTLEVYKAPEGPTTIKNVYDF